MDTDTRSGTVLRAAAKKNDAAAIRELGIRNLTGILGEAADPAGAVEMLGR